MKNIIYLLSFIISLPALASMDKIPLMYAANIHDDLQLRGSEQRTTIPLELVNTESIQTLNLTLFVDNNNPVQKTTLWIYYAGKTLAEIELEQKKQTQIISLSLPGSLLSEREKGLTLRVRHQAEASGEPIDSTRLRTTIKQKSSNIQVIRNHPDPITRYSLADFETMLRNGALHRHIITLIPASDSTDARQIKHAVELVQGITLRSQSDQYSFKYHQSIPATSERQVIVSYGVQKELVNKKRLPPAIAQRIRGPYIGLIPETDSQPLQLVISGQSPFEVEKAIRYFANQNNKLPGEPDMTVNRILPMPDKTLQNNVKYPLSEFSNQRELTYRPLQFDILMPANTVSSDSDYAKINLLLTHRKVKPDEGKLVLRVNGAFTNSIRLRSGLWRTTHLYRLRAPMKTFKPGINRITIELHHPGLSSFQSAKIIAENSNLELGSWIRFIPSEDHQVTPDNFLEIAQDCGEETQISVNSQNPEELAVLWRLSSYVALKTNKTTPKLLITGNEPQSRPFLISLSPPSEHDYSENTPTVFTTIKNRLFHYLLHEEERPQTQYSGDMYWEDTAQMTTFENPVAFVKQGHKPDWYRISIAKPDLNVFSQYLVTPSPSHHAGTLNNSKTVSEITHTIKALFFGLPITLALIVLTLIWIVSTIIYRATEKKNV